MLFGYLRRILRISCLVALAALLCLMLPRALSAMEGSQMSTEGAVVGAAQAPFISDIGNSAHRAKTKQASGLSAW